MSLHCLCICIPVGSGKVGGSVPLPSGSSGGEVVAGYVNRELYREYSKNIGGMYDLNC